MTILTCCITYLTSGNFVWCAIHYDSMNSCWETDILLRRLWCSFSTHIRQCTLFSGSSSFPSSRSTEVENPLFIHVNSLQSCCFNECRHPSRRDSIHSERALESVPYIRIHCPQPQRVVAETQSISLGVTYCLHPYPVHQITYDVSDIALKKHSRDHKISL